jgi:hypothetical protein
MRKPEPPSKPANANDILNRFLKENNLVLGLSRPQVDYTNNGQIIIGRPNIIAVFAKDLPDRPQKVAGNN